MTEHKCTHRMTIIRIPDGGGAVVCQGEFAAADGKGTHALLNPVLRDAEIARIPAEPGRFVPFQVGDIVLRYDDGSHEHVPQP